MKRIYVRFSILVLMIYLVAPLTEAQRCESTGKAKKKTVACPKKLKSIKDCGDKGCGSVDPLLNTQKNTTEGDPDTARDMNFADFAALPECVSGYTNIGAPRKRIREAGEGDMVRVVAWALAARPQQSRGKDNNGNPKKGESCNCGFNGVNDPENTDVHIVLVDGETLKLKSEASPKLPPSKKHPKGVPAKSAATNTLQVREEQSQTAEYAPRVRVSRQEDFDGFKLKDLIGPKGGALKVRVTGLLMYDSEHAYGPHKLTRNTDWEIHPVFRLEYCPKNKSCKDKSDANWLDINN